MDILTYFEKPKLIFLLQQKGGSGKTTLARNIGHGLKLRGLKVMLVDCDPQASLMEWSMSNEGLLIPVVQQKLETLQSLRSNYSNYHIIIVDTPGKFDKVLTNSVVMADIVLIPVRPTSDDSNATAIVAAMIKERKELTNGLPDAAFIKCQVVKNSILSREIDEPLVEYGIPVFDNYMSHMVCYPTTASEGNTVFSLGENHPASIQMSKIIDELLERFIYAN